MKKIPRIIHYCWFGKGEKPNSVKKYMSTWKKYMPDFEIIEWNESNFDVKKLKYTAQAYKVKKYAFVSDYVRLKALYEYGGIYFDTDVEVLKNISEILEDKDIYGFEQKDTVMTGVMIARPHSNIIAMMLEKYEDLNFINEDGSMNTIPNTKLFTEILIKNGLICNNEMQEIGNYAKIYPIDFFSTYDMDNSCFCITNNSYTIHHYDGSWSSSIKKIKKRFKRILSKVVGKNFYTKIRLLKKKGKR